MQNSPSTPPVPSGSASNLESQAVEPAEDLLSGSSLAPVPAQSKHSNHFEPVHEVDYIIDWYAILKVPDEIKLISMEGPKTEAQEALVNDAIKVAYREAAKANHPDRLAHVDPQLQTEAARKFKLICRANEVLCDDALRAEYNARLKKFEEEDANLVSKTGATILSLNRRIISVDKLLTDYGAQGLSEQEGLILASSGYNEDTFNFIREQFEAAEKPSAALRAAYKDQLDKRAAYLAGLEEIAWNKAGVANQARVERLTSAEAYVEQVEELIAETEGLIGQRVQQRLHALASNVGNPLLLPGGEVVSEGARSENLPRLASDITEAAQKSFGRKVKEIREIAAQQKELLEARQKFVNWKYLHDINTRSDSLLILVDIDGVIPASFLAVRTGSKVSISGIEVPQAMMENAVDLDLIRNANSGLKDLNPDVALLILDKEFDITFQISVVVAKHFED